MASLRPYPRAKNQPCFVLRYIHPDTRKLKTEYLHCRREEAERIKALKESELTHIRYGYDDLVPRNMRLAEIRDRFLNWVGRNRSLKTYHRYRQCLDEFIAVVGDVPSVHRHHFEAFRAANPNRSPGGINAVFRMVTVALNWARDMEYISQVPRYSRILDPGAGKKKPRILSDEEIKTILQSHIPRETRELIELFLLTGARAGELLSANFSWGDYDRSRRFVTLGSGNKLHQVELSDAAVAILDRWKQEGRPAPLPYTYTYIRKRIRNANRISGVSFTAHDLRRAAGAILLRNGATIYEVSKFLGHSSVTVTEKHYIDLIKSEYEILSRKLETGLSNIAVKN